MGLETVQDAHLQKQMVRGSGLLSLLTVYTQCCYQQSAVPTMQGWLLGLSGLRTYDFRV